MDAQEESSHYFKQKRDEYLIEIRKKKNTNHIEARRMKLTSASDTPNNADTNKYVILSVNQLCECFRGLYQQEDFNELVFAAEAIRRVTSKDDYPPIEELYNGGLFPFVLNILMQPALYDVKFIKECSWIALNMASSSAIYINYMVGLNAIPIALQLMDYDDQDIKENAIWLLTNIAGESLEYRKYMLENGIADKLGSIIEDSKIDSSSTEILSWMVSNLCRGKPYPEFKEVECFLPYIQQWVIESKNEKILVQCAFALSYLTDTDSEENLEKIFEMDILKELRSLLRSKNSTLKKFILRTIGNMSATSDEQMQVLLNTGFIDAIYPLLFDSHETIRKEVCWIYSNFLAGWTSQANAVFAYEEGIIIKTLFKMASEDVPVVSEECIFALCNASEAGQSEVGYLVSLGWIEMIIELLTKLKREDILRDCLIALTTILGEGMAIATGPEPLDNPYFEIFFESRGVEALERLQNFPGQVVEERIKILFSKFVDRM